MSTFTIPSYSSTDEEIIAIFRQKGWFVGRGFEFGDKSNFLNSQNPVTLKVVESGNCRIFRDDIPFFAVWQLGISILITEAKVSSVRPEVFLVCHKPIVLNGKRYVVGYDRGAVDRSVLGEGESYPLGRIDLWDIDLLQSGSFPEWKGSKFCFVTLSF